MAMEDDDTFPAIARVTQRFHALRTTTHRHVDTVGNDDEEGGDPSERDAVDWAFFLGRLARDVETDVATVHADMDEMYADVAAETVRVTASVEKLTAAFARGDPFTGWCEPTPRRTHRISTVSTKRHRHRGRGKPPVVALRIVRSGAIKAVPLTETVTTRSPTPARSRASRLAIEATSATTIQRAIRRFLDLELYSRNGRTQLRLCAAQAMGRASRVRWWLRRWRQSVRRRVRLRRKLMRRGDMSRKDLLLRCVERAARVVATDGKFAQAKAYHRLRRLGNVLLAWIRATTMGRDEVW